MVKEYTIKLNILHISGLNGLKGEKGEPGSLQRNGRGLPENINSSNSSPVMLNPQSPQGKKCIIVRPLFLYRNHIITKYIQQNHKTTINLLKQN